MKCYACCGNSAGFYCDLALGIGHGDVGGDPKWNSKGVCKAGANSEGVEIAQNIETSKRMLTQFKIAQESCGLR